MRITSGDNIGTYYTNMMCTSELNHQNKNESAKSSPQAFYYTTSLISSLWALKLPEETAFFFRQVFFGEATTNCTDTYVSMCASVAFYTKRAVNRSKETSLCFRPILTYHISIFSTERKEEVSYIGFSFWDLRDFLWQGEIILKVLPKLSKILKWIYRHQSVKHWKTPTMLVM
jgi:hypothetical protein